MSIFHKIGAAAFVAAATALPMMAQESQAVTIPETGVDISGYVSTAITSIGGVIAVCVGGFFAFLLIKKGVKFASSMLR